MFRVWIVVHLPRLRLPALPGMVRPVVVALAMVCFPVLVVAVPVSLVVLPVVPLFDSLVPVASIVYLLPPVEVFLLMPFVVVSVN